MNSDPKIGQSVLRREDLRLLTGRGQYTDDHPVRQALHLAVLRSPAAYARITRLDVSAARAMPGVFTVVTAEDIRDWIAPMVAPSKMLHYQPTQMPALAVDVVRYVGEPVAVVAAVDRYRAEDALEAIQCELEPLDAEHDPERAASEQAPILHPELSSNVLVFREFVRGDPTQGFADATHTVGGRFRFRRKTPVALENRACFAEFDAGRRQLRLTTSTQVPGIVKDAIAEFVRLPSIQITVIAPDVGGGFGGKTSVYPEELLVSALAVKLGRTVKWTGDRMEDLLATSQAFDEVVDAELAVGADGSILALRAKVTGDVGAYSIYPWTAGIEPVQAISFMPGPYRITNYHGAARAVATPKAPAGPYRGVGRPISTFVMERLMDMAAARVGLDPVVFRQKNLINPDEFPFRTGSGIVWDRSAFQEGIAAAALRFDYDHRRRQQQQARETGRLVGIGVASYAELTGIGSRISASPGMPINTGTDTCCLTLDSTGRLTAAFGCASHGQGHETILAQVVADATGACLDDITIVVGDTSAVPYSTGSYASRSAVLSGGAALKAGRELRERLLNVAAHAMQTTPDQCDVLDSTVINRQTNERLSFHSIARRVYTQVNLPEELRVELSVSAVYDPVFGTTSSATHMVQVEIDPVTLAVEIQAYVVAEDCGQMINPMLVEGQIRGAVAQGIGAALFEEVFYDETGQLQTASLADYLVPSAPEVPNLEIVHLDTQSPSTLGGFRGVGEGGTIGAPAAIANAISDALSGFGVGIQELPATPQRLFESLQSCEAYRSLVANHS